MSSNSQNRLSVLTAPTYTQMPNILFDEWLPNLKFGELKVLMVILRKTFGWHKVRDRISLSQLEKLTGLSNSNVCKAVKALQKKGLIVKNVEGEIGRQESYYEIVVTENSVVYTTPCNRTSPPPTKGDTKETLTKEIKKDISNDISKENATANAFAKQLLQQIKEFHPNFKEPDLAKWTKGFDAILRLDKRSEEDVRRVLDLLKRDAFQMKVNLCPDKIRKNFDRLIIEIIYNKPCKKLPIADNFDKDKFAGSENTPQWITDSIEKEKKERGGKCSLLKDLI